MKNLTPKQKAFVKEYIRENNGYRAALNAGYSGNSARITASRLLTNANIQKEIQDKRNQIERELRQTFISDALTARKVMIKILNDPEASDKDKLTAAKDLLDRAGFKPSDRKEISGPNRNPIEIVFTEPK